MCEAKTELEKLDDAKNHIPYLWLGLGNSIGQQSSPIVHAIINTMKFTISLLVVGLGVVFALMWQSDFQTETVTWQYENIEFGFALRLPGDWAVEQSPPEDYVARFFPVDQTGEGYSISILKLDFAEEGVSGLHDLDQYRRVEFRRHHPNRDYQSEIVHSGGFEVLKRWDMTGFVDGSQKISIYLGDHQYLVISGSDNALTDAVFDTLQRI